MPHSFRHDFPIFQAHPELVYLDSAATVQKPQVVIDAEREFYEKQYATAHRGLYDLAVAATDAYEQTRQTIQQFINTRAAGEIVFTPNATFALNLAASIEEQKLGRGDEIILTVAEHHSNILPWQRVAARTGAKLIWLELDETYRFPLTDLQKKISDKTKVVAVAHISNVLGYIAPLEQIVAAAHRVGARVVIDAAQSAGRLSMDVQALDADYVAFSGHKLYGPTGTGWLYAKENLLEAAEPMIVGGGTIKSVQRDSVVWHDVPWRFEAGTYDIDGFIGLGAAAHYMTKIGMDTVAAFEEKITEYALEKLQAISGCRVIGPDTAGNRAPIFSLQLSDGGTILHSHDVVAIANEDHVCLRAGHHCAQPLMKALGVTDLVRASAGIYNSFEDIDRLVQALERVKSVLGKPIKKRATVPTR